MPRSAMPMNSINPRPALWSIALAAALGHSLTWAIGTITGINSLNVRSAWWQTAKAFFPIVTPSQWLALLGWATATGIMIALGARRRQFDSWLPLSAPPRRRAHAGGLNLSRRRFGTCLAQYQWTHRCPRDDAGAGGVFPASSLAPGSAHHPTAGTPTVSREFRLSTLYDKRRDSNSRPPGS